MEQAYQNKQNEIPSQKWLLMGTRWIFGPNKPVWWIRIVCYIHFLIVFLFLVWHSIAFSALRFRHLIFDIKNIDVDELIALRAEQLHFKPHQFLQLVLNQHLIALAAWFAVGIATVFIWRKNKNFVFWMLIGLGTYFSTLILFLGWRYFHEDLTWFDKIAYSTVLVGSILAYLWIRLTQIPESETETKEEEN